MKVIKTANGNQIKLSKSEWESIGKTAGWLEEEMEDMFGGEVDEYKEEYNPYVYYINLDERGEFYADVRDSLDQTVFEIKGFDIFESGFMKHKEDLAGLKNYLVSLNIMDEDKELVKGN